MIEAINLWLAAPSQICYTNYYQRHRRRHRPINNTFTFTVNFIDILHSFRIVRTIVTKVVSNKNNTTTPKHV